ncbi:GerMN domain-containing protein [Paenibacillus sp. 3LSP]|uniref:GerMN domain-containing protein n=1 Tax=Paenibacillus TaxID=44249 RepID=UPI0028FD2F45|nr:MULTISPECIES: GerMN domain-containing protein [Paenibacillus]MDU0330353.1 GerMN domain-containing protein [Paenibacillus sp. 3LSP]MEC2343915.1 GerMN domain-containing protein [Paenibacillus barengoltzii]
MKRKVAVLLALVAMLGVAAGCGNKPTASPPENEHQREAALSSGAQQGETQMQEVQGPVNGTDDSGDPQTDAQAGAEKLTIQVYLTDDDMLELKQTPREIEFTADQSKYESAFEALQTAEDSLLSLWEKVVLNTVKFDSESGQLAIDIHLPDEARLGAGGESLAIEALKNTMFQFEEVQQIELTVDGQQVESLMGHVDLEHPMNR